MKRVRIVAITAVALGAAVTAGTKFQQAREAAMMASAPAAAPAPTMTAASSVPLLPGISPPRSAQVAAPAEPAAPSLTTLAEAPAPAPVAAPQAPAPAVSLIASAPEAPVARPSIAAPLGAVAPATGLAQASVVPGVNAGPGTAAPAPADDMLRQLASTEAPATEDTEPLDPALQAELAACAVWLVVTPAAGAMLETSVYAPCDQGAAVTLTHAGLSFDTHLGPDGQLLEQIPALTDQAMVTLRFQDGREQSDQTQVPDLANVERVVVQWQGPAELQLNAYEFGAGYADAGHVYQGNARTAGVTDQGFLTVLGDPAIDQAHLAQVYSYPRGETPRSGHVALEIEVPVTDAICGKPLTANTIELHGTASAQVRQIRLDMPGCDGAGGYLVLPGVLPELQIALNN